MAKSPEGPGINGLQEKGQDRDKMEQTLHSGRELLELHR